MAFQIGLDGLAIVDDDPLLRLGEADLALVAQLLQSRLALDVEQAHGFLIVDPFCSILSILTAKSSYNLFNQGIESGFFKADDLHLFMVYLFVRPKKGNGNGII